MVSTENKKYKVTRYNDLCYNPANLKFGVICLNKYGDAIFSPIYITFEVNEEVDVDFIGANVTRWDFINHALRFQQGTVYERMAVSPEDFLSIKCYLPSKAEQIRISSLIQVLDERIEKQQRLVEALKKYKRGLLSFAFEEMSISDNANAITYLFSEIAQRRKEKYCPDSGVEYPCIELEHIEQGTGRLLGSVSSTAQSSTKTVAKTGDVLFGKLRPYLRKFAFAEQDMVCSSEIWVFVPSKYVLPKYLYYLIQTEHFMQVANISSGTKMPRAEWENIEKEPFDIPCISVQEQIVSIMEALDNEICLSDDIIRSLSNAKTGLLQQLFI